MPRLLEPRLRRLEQDRPPQSRMFTVFGRSDAEHEEQIAGLILDRRAGEYDKFVCIVRFSDAPLPAPVCPGAFA